MTTCQKCREEFHPEQIWQSVDGSFCEECYREIEDARPDEGVED